MNSEKQIQNINVDLIIPNRFQPRLTFDENALNELAKSIKEHGIIQPLVLRKAQDKYEIIAGERRYKAAQIAGLTEVPAIITDIDDEKSAEVALVENVQRKNLNSMEEAKSYKKILDKGTLTQEVLAQKMGISQSTLANKLRLLNLAPEVQDALMNNKISERHARSLLMVHDKLKQISLLNKVIAERLTVRQLDNIIKENNEDDSNVLNKEPVFIKEEQMNQENIENNVFDVENTEVKDNSSLETLDMSDNNVEEKNKPSNSIFDNFFNSFSGPKYPSLEDETVNMNLDNDSSFNPFNNLDAAESMPVKGDPIEVLNGFGKEEEKEAPLEDKFLIKSEDLSSVKKAYDNLKRAVEAAGFKISSEEFDFEDIYQLIIKVDKQS